MTLLAPTAETLSQRQRQILEVLAQRGGELWLQELLQLCQTSASVVKTLEKKGCVAIAAENGYAWKPGRWFIPNYPKP